jgi:type IV pilus assembly protein PilY1
MIVPGGYDLQFEDPTFTPGSNTLGNAVYIVDASNGTLLWSTSASGASLNNTNLKYSITGRVSTLDRDADGLADHLYFADLGGQVFRVDVDNDNQVSTTSTAPLAKRVVRLADLGDSKTGIEKPRFYEAPTVTVHDVGAERFILVNVASGDRSSPLDVIDTTKGGQGKTRSADNAVYGIIDRDVARTDLYTMADSSLQTKDLKLASLLANPKTSGKTQGDMLGAARTGRSEGWYYPLAGTLKKGSLKGYGEMIAINGDLYVNVYNPEVQATNNDCSAQVVGETVVRRYCLPFGLDNGSSCTVPTEGYYGFRLGKGMLEASLGPTVSSSKINSETRQLIFQDPNRKQDDKGTPGQLRQFSTPKGLVSTRWFERQPKVSRPSK